MKELFKLLLCFEETIDNAGKSRNAKCIPQLNTHLKQKELERVWELIIKDPEWIVALRKQKIAQVQYLSSTTLVDAFERTYL